MSVGLELQSSFGYGAFFMPGNRLWGDDPGPQQQKKGYRTMDYENFKERFVEDLRDKLYESGAEVNISVHTVNKLNESYEAETTMDIYAEATNEKKQASFEGLSNKLAGLF